MLSSLEMMWSQFLDFSQSCSECSFVFLLQIFDTVLLESSGKAGFILQSTEIHTSDLQLTNNVTPACLVKEVKCVF